MHRSRGGIPLIRSHRYQHLLKATLYATIFQLYGVYTAVSGNYSANTPWQGRVSLPEVNPQQGQNNANFRNTPREKSSDSRWSEARQCIYQ